MPAGSESEELRTLRQKAYAREGGLTAAEGQRLRELEDARRSAAAGRAQAERVDSESVPTRPDPLVALAGDANDPAAETTTGPAAAAAAEDSVPPETFARGLRRHSAAVIAAAVVLAIGIGAGGVLLAPRDAGIPLTDEQQQRRAELAAAVFDPSSIRAVAQEDDALAWYATQEGGESTCLILDVGAQSQTDCVPSDQIEQGLSASLAVPLEAGAEEGAAESEVVFATLILSTAGEPMVGMQRWSTASSALGWFDGAERDRAESLIAEGFELGLSSLGRFRGAPVWVADRLTEQGSTERCLIIDSASSVSCTPLEMALREGIGAQVIDADPAGTVTAIVLLEMKYTGQQTPYLTVTEAPVTEVSPGESVLVEAPPGDPIEVEPPGRGTKD